MKNRIICIIALVTFFGSIYAQTKSVSFPNIDSWKIKEPTEFYDEDNLWEYINGAADYYLNYNFLDLQVAEYYQSEEVYFKVEIYNHGNQLNALGIYAYERPELTDFKQLGTEGYIEPSAINFYQSGFYVKIHSHSKDSTTIQAMKDVAYIVSSSLSDVVVMPPMIFTLFPKANKQTHTEKYYPSNFLGLGFFKNASEVKYQVEKEVFSVFVIECKNLKDAEKTMLEYFRFVKQSIVPEASVIYQLDDMFNGQVLLALKDDKLIGAYNFSQKSHAEEIMKLILKNITSSD